MPVSIVPMFQLTRGAAADATRALAQWSRDGTATEHLRAPTIVAPTGAEHVRASAARLRGDLALVNETLYHASLYTRSPQAYRREVPSKRRISPLLWVCFPHLLGPALAIQRVNREVRTAFPRVQAMNAEFTAAWAEGMVLDHTLGEMALTGEHSSTSLETLRAEAKRFVQQVGAAIAASTTHGRGLDHFPSELRDRIAEAGQVADRVVSYAVDIDAAVLSSESVATSFSWAPPVVRQRASTSIADIATMAEDLRRQLHHCAQVVADVRDKLREQVALSNDQLMRVFGAVYTYGMSEVWLRHRQPNGRSREAIPVLEACRDAAGEADAALALVGSTLAQASVAPDVATADAQVTTAAAAAEQARLWCLEHDRLASLAAAATCTAYESDLLTQVRWPRSLVDGMDELSTFAVTERVAGRGTEASLLAAATSALLDDVRALAA